MLAFAPMAIGRRGRAALGLSVHTGWAALVAIAAESPTSVRVLDRRRLEMMPGKDPASPRFVYHAARELRRDVAERLIRESAELSTARAKAAIAAAVEALASGEHEVVASGLLVGTALPTTSLDAILANHSLVHSAEGELFRGAVRGACAALGIPVTEVRSKDLQARAARALGIPIPKISQQLAGIGKAAGRPWAKDQKDSCLAAWIALLA
ncbi:MAG TPA: hypothetical protein VIV57_25350 [Anaeromyxobacter sp.]